MIKKNSPHIKCKICSSPVHKIFSDKILNKYEIDYFQCSVCDFIQTEDPYWLDEAYDTAITNLDLGLISRNLNYSELISNIIINNFNKSAKFLDYAGGYGMFTRLMRDKGFDYYHHDKFCVNLYAQNFELDDLPKGTNFEFVTAFEVFEHFDKPINEIKKIFRLSDILFFSTELQPDSKIKSSNDWWYFTPETGQHIAFYSKKTLKVLAKKLNCFFYTEKNLHVFSKKKLNKEKVFQSTTGYPPMKSLLEDDFQLSKKIIEIENLNSLKKKEYKSSEEKAAVFESKFLKSLIDLENMNKLVANKDQEITNKDQEITKKDQEMANKDQKIAKLIQEMANKDQKIAKLIQEMANKDQKIAKLIQEMANKDQKIANKDQEIAKLIQENEQQKISFNRAKNEIIKLNNDLLTIQNTKLWKFAEKIRKLINKLLPKNSLQRKFLKKIKLFYINYLKYYFNLLQLKIKNLFNYFNTDTNRSSKKIVYIGHSYHDKTQSTAFLINYLKEHFEVTVVLDETWQGKDPPDLGFIDDSYLGVIFFQMIYSPEIISKIKNKNIVFFPMYDASGGLPDEYWFKYEKLKFINFSKNLHKKLIGLNLNSLYVQYFPKINKFIPGNKNKIFFWQRITGININTLEGLLGNKTSLKIHLHKAIDPEQTFIKPTKKQEQKFSITYSNWLKNKNDLLNFIKKSAIYVAPRAYEGIGLSFLEAMAMGKAVIAVNNPTMNEYIKHNETGYLFNLNDVDAINLENLKLVQLNCHKFMRDGYNNWEKNKIKIIKFIRK